MPIKNYTSIGCFRPWRAAWYEPTDPWERLCIPQVFIGIDPALMGSERTATFMVYGGRKGGKSRLLEELEKQLKRPCVQKEDGSILDL